VHDANQRRHPQDAPRPVTDPAGRWRALLADLGRDDPEAVGDDLLRRWDEPHRHYHTSAHLGAMLALVADAGPAVRLAVWFHDAVYDPRSDRNEEDSAALAREALGRLGLAADLVAEVSRLVLLTKSHATTPGDDAGRLLLDADLAVLGTPPDEYDAYAAAIRREYAWVEEAAYRAGRAAVLERFLQREWIFQTERFRAGREGPARDNLAREIAALRTGAGDEIVQNVANPPLQRS